MKIRFRTNLWISLLVAYGPRPASVCLWFTLFLCLAWAGLAPAAVLRVPQDYGSVRSAYAAAADDDVIAFESGFYLTTPGELLPAKRVLLLATNGDAILAANIPPPNDNFENRTLLAGESVATYTSTFAATRQAAELTQVDGKSAWWTWTARSVCPVRFSTEGSAFLPTIALFNDSTLAGLSGAFIVQGAGAVEWTPSFPGQVFNIAVFGQNDSAGDLVLHISTVTVVNDSFSAATPTAGPRVSVETSNCAASREAGEPTLLGSASGRSVWWTWTAPYESEAQVALTDLDGGAPALGIYTGSDVALLTPVVGNDSTPDPTNRVFRFHASAGTMYRVAGDRDLSVAGRMWLRIRQRPPLNIASVIYVTTNSLPSGEFRLTAHVTVANSGLGDSNPLRLRLLSGTSVSLQSPPDQTHWTREPLPGGVLQPGSVTLVTLDTFLPDPGLSGRDVVLVLEESFENQWLIQDAKNLFTYSRLGISSFNDEINSGGPILLTPPLLGGVYAPWKIRATQLHADSMIEGAMQQFYGTVQLTNASPAAVTLTFTNTLWTVRDVPWFPPLFATQLTNGLFHSGSVTQDTQVVISAGYRFNGVTNLVSSAILITNLPAPLLTNWPAAFTLANGSFGFTLRGVPGRHHRVQVTDSFVQPPSVTVWRDLATNVLAPNGSWLFVDSSGRATNAARYYRVLEQP